MREIVHVQAGQCGNQIGAKVRHASHVCVGSTQADPLTKKHSPLYDIIMCVCRTLESRAELSVHLLYMGY